MVAAAAAFAGDAEFAARAYDALVPRSGRIVVAAMVGAAVLDLYDRMLLALAATTARWDVIETHAQRALGDRRPARQPGRGRHACAPTGRTRCDRRGHAGDAQRARDAVDAARWPMPNGSTCRACSRVAARRSTP